MWDGWSRGRRRIPVYAPWLDDHKEELEKHKGSRILDLGCGTGANTQYLTERGYRVLAADYSEEALKSIDRFIPESVTKYVDMGKMLPFEDETFYMYPTSMIYITELGQGGRSSLSFTIMVPMPEIF